MRYGYTLCYFDGLLKLGFRLASSEFQAFTTSPSGIGELAGRVQPFAANHHQHRGFGPHWATGFQPAPARSPASQGALVARTPITECSMRISSPLQA